MNTFKIFIRLGLLATFCLIILAFQLKSFNTLERLWKKPVKVESSYLEVNENAKIQVAFLLDTSNSMDGLIDQAKAQLWGILNELVAVRKDGSTPIVEVALYEYGNTNLLVTNNFIRQVLPFTRDVDKVSQELFDLKTDGGDEYCTTVIQTALNGLTWSQKEDDLHLVYIAGNESFLQGQPSTKEVLTLAKQKDVEVTTIFCGPQEQGVLMHWPQGATQNGAFFNINQDEVTVYQESPYDQEINQLNQQLNGTYIPYGDQGAVYQQNLETQDINAFSYSQSNMADRVAFKCSKNYKNENWDVVDAYKKDKSVLKKKETMPEQFKVLTDMELEAKIMELAEEREAIQTKIKALNSKRQNYIAEEMAKNAGEEKQNLCKSIVAPMKKVAQQKGFKVE